MFWMMRLAQFCQCPVQNVKMLRTRSEEWCNYLCALIILPTSENSFRVKLCDRVVPCSCPSEKILPLAGLSLCSLEDYSEWSWVLKSQVLLYNWGEVTLEEGAQARHMKSETTQEILIASMFENFSWPLMPLGRWSYGAWVPIGHDNDHAL